MTKFIAKEGDVALAFLTSWSSWGTIDTSGAVVVTMDPGSCILVSTILTHLHGFVRFS